MQTIIELRQTAIGLRRKASTMSCLNDFALEYLALAIRYDELADSMSRADRFIHSVRKLA
jgi:hypothetical protein